MRRARVTALALLVAALYREARGCADDREVAHYCKGWANEGECEKNPSYMLEHCGTACGCDVRSRTAADTNCTDRDTSGSCAAWSAAGECEKNPAFMKIKCALSCNTCDMLDFKKRCPLDPDRAPAVLPGGITETFERALSLFPEYSPQILSRDPWTVSFDNFIMDDEVDALLGHAGGRYSRSLTSNGRQDDEFVPQAADIRTSYTTWCDTDACKEDPAVLRLTQRMAEVTRVPANNSEFIQLLRYKARHHFIGPCASVYWRLAAPSVTTSTRRHAHTQRTPTANSTAATTTQYPSSRRCNLARACTRSSCTSPMSRRAAAPGPKLDL